MKLHRTCEGDGALRVESDVLGRHEATVHETGLTFIRDTADGSVVALDPAQLLELRLAAISAVCVGSGQKPLSGVTVVELDPGDPAGDPEAEEGGEALEA